MGWFGGYRGSRTGGVDLRLHNDCRHDHGFGGVAGVDHDTGVAALPSGTPAIRTRPIHRCCSLYAKATF